MCKALRFIILTPFLLSSLWVCGCTVLRKPAEDTIVDSKQLSKQKASSSTNVEAQLLATAKSIEESLSILAAAEKAENPPVLNTAPLVTPEGGMGGTIDVEWTGPIGPLVEKLADLTNYRVKVLGQEPAIPILVSISMKKAVIAGVLQNASLQVGKRAHILVFPSSRLIEVRYLS